MLCSSSGSAAVGQDPLVHYAATGYFPPHHHQQPYRDFNPYGPAGGFVQDHSIHSSYPSNAPLGLGHTSNIGPDGKKCWDNPSTHQPQQQSVQQNRAADSVGGPAKLTTTAQRNRPSKSSTGATKKRKRVATMAQRRAANIRERRRMFNLNEAFDKLRRKVPTFAYEKRLSRIETLKLAITYIGFMDQVIRSERHQEAGPARTFLSSSSPSSSSAASKSCSRIAVLPAPASGVADEIENSYRGSPW